MQIQLGTDTGKDAVIVEACTYYQKPMVLRISDNMYRPTVSFMTS